MKHLGNPVVFVVLYILFMLPTYYLPYVGSNSAAVGTLGQLGAAAGDLDASAGVLPQFWLHLGSLFILIAVTWFRGTVIDKKWLVTFPIVAAIFDLAPALNLIPLIPTVMHLLAIILAVKGTTVVRIEQQAIDQHSS